MTDLLDGIPVVDGFGLNSIRLLRDCLKRGGGEAAMQAALEAEMENPGWNDPEWCAMIVNLANGGEGIEFGTPRTYRCPFCLDKPRGEDGVRGGIRIRTDDKGVRWSDYCTCLAGRTLKAGHQRADESRTKRRDTKIQRNRGLSLVTDPPELPK